MDKEYIYLENKNLWPSFACFFPTLSLWKTNLKDTLLLVKKLLNYYYEKKMEEKFYELV